VHRGAPLHLRALNQLGAAPAASASRTAPCVATADNLIAGNGQTELPVFRLGYSDDEQIAGKKKPTKMELHYVTSIVPGPAAAALDLAGLENDKDL
jgi:hypothetical protein